MIRAGIIACALLAASPASARWYATDGDSLVEGLSNERVRLENVDAPELHGACPAEIELAQRARVFVADALRWTKPEIHRTGRVDRYGRTIALVTIRGRGDLGELLIAAGLARAYHGDRRHGWC